LQQPALSQQPASSQQAQSGVPQQHSPSEHAQTHFSHKHTHGAFASACWSDEDELLPEKAKAETTQTTAVETLKKSFTNMEYSPRKRNLKTELLVTRRIIFAK
jgi:hypothetical protein